MGKFELWVLYIIVLFVVVILLGFICICKYKIFLWILKVEEDFEVLIGLKFVVVNVKKGNQFDVEKYEVLFDGEMGNRGVELELEFILELGKVYKFFCG